MRMSSPSGQGYGGLGRGGFPQKWEEQMGACPGKEPWASFRENDLREAQPLTLARSTSPVRITGAQRANP